MKKIQLIVEGHGEVAAAPVLLRRLIAAAEAWEIDIGRPIRRNRGQLVKQSELEQSVRLALLQPGCGAVLIMFDGDRVSGETGTNRASVGGRRGWQRAV